MKTSSINTLLSNIQAELLKIFSANIPNKHLSELKYLIARFLMEKARDSADTICDGRGYSDQELLGLLNE